MQCFLLFREILRMGTCWLLVLVVFVLVLSPIKAWALEKDVTVTWSTNVDSSVIGYRLYLADSATLEDKRLACERYDSDISSISCSQVEMNTSPTYFAIAAVTDSEEVLSPSYAVDIPELASAGSASLESRQVVISVINTLLLGEN
ncbi:hypothetical protein [Desulfolithobacter sp.]